VTYWHFKFKNVSLCHNDFLRKKFIEFLAQYSDWFKSYNKLLIVLVC